MMNKLQADTVSYTVKYNFQDIKNLSTEERKKEESNIVFHLTQAFKYNNYQLVIDDAHDAIMKGYMDNKIWKYSYLSSCRLRQIDYFKAQPVLKGIKKQYKKGNYDTVRELVGDAINNHIHDERVSLYFHLSQPLGVKKKDKRLMFYLNLKGLYKPDGLISKIIHGLWILIRGLSIAGVIIAGITIFFNSLLFVLKNYL